ncbi:hypothetical protein ACFE04_024469 [Oxalis oulophora]
MDEKQLIQFVELYLKKKGFKGGELDLSNLLQQHQYNHLHQESDSAPARYHDSYSKLRSWTYNSLDFYKHDLLRVLYPVFIHCFMDLIANQQHVQHARNFFNTFRKDHEMMHLKDLQLLDGVKSPAHLKMEFTRSLRQSKLNIKMCLYSYELLLQYLHKTKSTTILGLINEHINFKVTTGQPSTITDDVDFVMLIGSTQDTDSQINLKEVHLGLLEDSLEDRLDKAGGLLSDSEKTDVKNKEVEKEEPNKKRSIEGGKQGATTKKSKKDKAAAATAKAARPEASVVPTAPRVKPELALPIIPTEVEHSILEDLRNRVQLSSVALPSVNFYTFINAHNGVNSASISHDGSLVAAGFSDSSLKIWDMAKLGQQEDSCEFTYHRFSCVVFSLKVIMVLNSSMVSVVLQGENDSTPTEQVIQSNVDKRPYTLYTGHSGPVYSASFSPLGDFILSSSADSTVRLWSTKLNANLVCYKGHNYPVWDVQFSPFGHYFATASHDRTARIWSMDKVQPLRIMAGHLSDVDCVQWHSNSNYIATGSSDKTVRMWDVESGECVRVFIGHRSMISSLAMSPDGRYMASGDEDGSIILWDLSNGQIVTPLTGHTSCVWSLAFSCEGSLLASGSADSTVKLWDVTTSTKAPKTLESKSSGSVNKLRSLKTLPTKSTPVYSLRFSRRNLLFAAGVLSKTALYLDQAFLGNASWILNVMSPRVPFWDI